MTCSRKFDRLLQVACLGLVGILTAAGCGGSSSNPKDGSLGGQGGSRTDGGPGGPDGPAPVQLTVSPLILNFGSVDVGSTSSTPSSVTVTNQGPDTSLSPTIIQPSPFSLAGNTCNTLPKGGTCTISMLFTPTIVGPAAGTLVVAGSLMVSLNGTGTAPADFTMTDKIDLGTVLVGASVTGKATVTATNPLTDLLCSVQSAGNIKADPTTTTCTPSLAKGASCTVGFTFSSATAGTKSGDEIICNAGLQTKFTAITAIVAAPAKLVITPANGSTAATTKGSNTINFTVANSGDVKTGTITAAISPANPEFSVTGTTCSVGILPLGTCTVTVTFAPTTDGTKTATLVVTDSGAPTAPASATVTGVATGPSNLAITGGPDLGTVALGGTGIPVTFTITNTGGTAAPGVVVSTNNAAFVIGNDGCTGQTLAKTNGSCTLTLTFTPAATGAPGAYSGLLTASSTGGNPFNLPITATASVPAALTVVPNPLAFNGISLNTQSGDGILTITNTGGASTGAITVPAGLGNGFVISGNTCSAALLPTQSCTMSIRYTPGAITQSTWTFTVTSASGASVTVSLTGTGKQPNVLELGPRDVKGCGELRSAPSASHAAVGSVQCFEDTAMGQADGSFPKTPVGATAPVTFTITNTNVASAGGINLESGPVTVTIGGTNAADFVKVSTTCGPSLQPGQTCLYIVSFKPSAPGLRTATISVTSTNGGNVGTNMEGIGLAPVQMQPCGYSESPTAGIAPAGIALAAGDALTSDVAKLACISKLATGSTDSSDRTGLDFGQVSLGANCNPMNVKWYLVTVNSSTAADFMNLITATLTDAATPSNFRIANAGGVDMCNNQNKDVSKGPQQCWISVEFMPQGTATGAKTATVTATGASSGTASAALTGTATGPLTIKPATNDFGTVVVNEAATTTVTLTVMNWSTTNTLGPVMASLSGPAAGDFRVVFDTCTDYYPPAPTYPADPNKPGLPPQAVASDGTASCATTGNNTCQVAYRFYPTAVGSRTATFTLTAGAVTSTATLSGVGVAETTITSAPAALAFGGIVLSNKSDYQAVTVTAGAGGVETGTLEFGLAGVQSDQFEIATGQDAGTCGVTDSQRLGGSNPMSCTVKVRYVPTVLGGLGAAKATLVILDPRDRTLTQKIALTGTGLTQLTITPNSGDFGLVAANENVTNTITFTVTNRGTASITAPTLAVAAPFTADPSTTCLDSSGTLAGSGGTCIVVVRLGAHPTPGVLSANPGVQVTGAATNDSTAAAQLGATVQADAILELVGFASGGHAFTPLTGPTINLGSVASGGTGSPVTLLFRNRGGHSTTQIHYYFYDKNSAKEAQDTADPDYYVVGDPSADGCVGNTLAGGQYCKVQLNFKPTHTGDLPVSFQLYAAIGGPPVATGVNLQGHGLDAATEMLAITPSFASLIGSPVSTGASLTAAIPFTVQNNATTSVSLTFAFTGHFQRDPVPAGRTECPAVLTAGNPCIVWVNFYPTDAAPTLDIDFNAGSITATGTAGAATYTAVAGMEGKVRSGTVLTVWNAFNDPVTGIDFGSVARNLPSAGMPFTVMNIGDAPTFGNTTVQISPVNSQFSATGCGSALAAFNIASPSTAATCAAQAVFTPSIATTGRVPASSGVALEADATGSTPAGAAGAAVAGDSGLMHGTCINPASLGITPPGTITVPGAFGPAPGVTPVALNSAEVFFTITNGTVTSTLTLPTRDFQSTTPITVSLTDSTNFLLDLDPNAADVGVQSCEKAKDQVTGNLVLRGNQQCAVGVFFTPQAMPASGAAFTTTLSATATTGGSPSVVLNATGRDDLYVDSPTGGTVSFGSVASGSVSPESVPSPIGTIDITIKNVAGAPATGLLSAVVAGQFFVETDSCTGTSLNGGDACVVSLQFAPTSAGAKTGTLTVSGTPGGSASIALTGTGI